MDVAVVTFKHHQAVTLVIMSIWIKDFLMLRTALYPTPSMLAPVNVNGEL